ncbi:MAG TPA: hypothetical protein VIE17_07350 [Methylophilaceae bacterium]
MKHGIHFYAVRAWFLLNAFVALYPPLYWAGGKQHPFIHDLPVSFVYFMAVCISITASILYAFWADSKAGELTS